MPLIEVRNLTKQFQIGHSSLVANHQINLSIFPGEILGLVGESGCGKSTLGKGILRLHEPTSGTIFYKDKDLCKISDKEMKSMRRHMQIVFQNPYSSLNPKMKVQDIISEPLEIHWQNETNHVKRVQELLELLNLDSKFINRLPCELSGGQRQRVAIARALALNPEFIVFDESLSSLDLSTQAQIVQILKNLHQNSGLTYLFISHDLSTMRSFASRIAVMYLGHFFELASSERLFQNPKHPYTQALLSAIPIPDPQIERKRSRVFLNGDLPSPFNPPKGCVFHPRCPLAKPICQQQRPAQREVEPGHFVSCHMV